jgi:hypothetical protein
VCDRYEYIAGSQSIQMLSRKVFIISSFVSAVETRHLSAAEFEIVQDGRKLSLVRVT